MGNVLTIARRDLGAYLHGIAAWVILAALLALEGVFFNAFALGGGAARYSHEVLKDFFYFNWGFAVVASVLLTMRSVAEERRDGTDVLLRTSTASDGQIIVGKWLAAMAVLLLFCLMSVYLPALIYVNGKVSPGHMMVGYLGVMATVGATSAIGIFSSTLFRNQLAAGLLSGVIVVTLIVSWIAADITDAPFSDIVAYASLYNQHYEPFSEGRLSISGLTYYGSLAGVFLLLATRILEGRRWE